MKNPSLLSSRTANWSSGKIDRKVAGVGAMWTGKFLQTDCSDNIFLEQYIFVYYHKFDSIILQSLVESRVECIKKSLLFTLDTVLRALIIT